MKSLSSTSRACLLTTLVVWQLSPALPAAQTISSLTESDIESSEARLALEAGMLDRKRLTEKLAASEEAIALLQKNLVVANNETEVFRHQATTLKLRLEAVGVEGAGGNIGKIEQRLLKAVNDLKIVEDERRKLQEALVRLSEAVLAYQKMAVTNHPESRLALEAEMRNAAEALGVLPPKILEASPVPSTLMDGMVISMKEDIALVVCNVGSNQGVRVGMPFRVLREGKTVGTVRVVDVREKIAGAVIQDLSSDKAKIQVGDRLTVEAIQ